MIARLEIAKQSADLCTGSLDQRLVYEMWRRGDLDRRLPSIRQCYQTKRAVLEQALKRELGELVSWPEPKGGFFLWAAFPDGVDTDALLPRAVRHGVVFVPGSAFFVEPHHINRARLSFSAPKGEQIRTAAARLASALREELGAASSGRQEAEPKLKSR
jgi:2-aminoadipate transaminase